MWEFGAATFLGLLDHARLCRAIAITQLAIAVSVGTLWPQAAGERGDSGTVYRVGHGVSAPRLVHRVHPKYTPEALRAKVQGDVDLYIEVGPDGTAHNIKVRRGLGFGLDEKAVEAIRKWRFEPGTKEGRPVTVGAVVAVHFRLEARRAQPPAAPGDRTGDQPVEMHSYFVKAPQGEGWSVEMDEAQDMVVFRRTGPGARFTSKTVRPGKLEPGAKGQTEDKVASQILSGQEHDLRKPNDAGFYAFGEFSRGVAKIGGKTLHLMSYAMATQPDGPIQIHYTVYLYLSPERHTIFYTFTLAAAHKVGSSVYETDPAIIQPVIDSFQAK